VSCTFAHCQLSLDVQLLLLYFVWPVANNCVVFIWPD
jgi:hypothetical protein